MTPLILSVLVILYHFVLRRIYDFINRGQMSNSPNITIAYFRGTYCLSNNVKLETFYKENRHRGYSSNGKIYMNEYHFKDKTQIALIFFHELYHAIKKHDAIKKRLYLMMGLSFLLLYIHWLIFTGVLIGILILFREIEKRQEASANDYSEKRTKSFMEHESGDEQENSQ